MASKPVKVSQLNNYIKRILETDPLLGNLSVVGEISNLKFHGSGHIYFTLKDEESKLSCFLARERFAALRYELAEGMEIIASGAVSVYERGGSYSLNVKDVAVEGMGNLTAAFLKLKEKLEKEGLFDEKYKKALPRFPRQVAVVTSETGAAVRDIIKVIRSRNNITNVIVYPCLVQGPNAAGEIARAIQEVNRLFPETDLMIVGRGGGSLEELWPFNEEIVARSIFLSEIPVISAVGHETDFTVADFAADRRAVTPTEAAQLAVPHIGELKGQILALGDDLRSSIDRILSLMELRAVRFNMDALRNQLYYRLKLAFGKGENLYNQLLSSAEEKLSDLQLGLQQAMAELKAGNPYEIMRRGYAAVLDSEGRLAVSASAFGRGDSLTVIFNDGKIKCLVEEVWRSLHEEK